MGVTRHIGEVKELPGLYVELFYNPQKKIIGKSLFQIGTFERIQKRLLPTDIQQFIDTIEAKDVTIIRGELFDNFIKSRKKERLTLKQFLSDCKEFVFCDTLFNGDTYLTLYNENILANTITRFHMDNSGREDLFFNEDEIAYEDVVSFLRTCSKKNKVTFFFNPKKFSCEESHSAFIATYKTEDRIYIAQLFKDIDIQFVRVFDKNMKEIQQPDVGMEKAKETIEVAIIERSARIFLKEHDSLL